MAKISTTMREIPVDARNAAGHHMLNTIKTAFLLIFLFFWAVSGTLAASAEEETLLAINGALERGDTEQFQKLVNLDGIINAGIANFTAEAILPENAGKLPPMLAMMFSNVVNQENIRNLLLQELRAFVLNGVASGSFAGKQLPGKKTEGIFAPLFANISLGRKEIRSIGEPMAADNGDSLITFVVRDWGNGQDYPVVGRMAAVNDGSSQDKYMRLMAVENLSQIMAQIRKEAETGEQQ